MNRLRKLLALSPREWIALLEAWLLLAWAEVRVRFPFGRSPIPTPPSGSVALQDGHLPRIRRLSELVRLAASHHLLPSSCLKEALALSWLLHRRGIPSRLHVGVARIAGGTMSAHSWLEVAGMVVIGDPHHRQYVPLQPVIKRSAPVHERLGGHLSA